MRTRAIFLAALMATGLAGWESRHVCVGAIECSAQAFCQYFRALRQEPLNPVERVVFSFVLANAKAHSSSRPHIHT